MGSGEEAVSLDHGRKGDIDRENAGDVQTARQLRDSLKYI